MVKQKISYIVSITSDRSRGIWRLLSLTDNLHSCTIKNKDRKNQVLEVLVAETNKLLVRTKT